MVFDPDHHPAILCLHHNDADGRASAAIVRRALGPEVRLYEINFGEPTPWNLIKSASKVIITDFTLPRQDMVTIAAEKDFIWIDHHVSAMKALADISPAWKGSRDSEEAACVLTWRFFFPTVPVPRGVVLIGDRDIWRLAEADTRPFSHGLRQQTTHPENDSLWGPLLDDDPELIERLVTKGQGLLESHLNYLRNYIKRFAFEAIFEGHRTLCVNRSGEAELIEMMCALGYELAYCYVDAVNNNRLVTIVMLGSRVVDVSQIAQKFGGGGHIGAAGFQFERTGNPFPPAASFLRNI